MKLHLIEGRVRGSLFHKPSSNAEAVLVDCDDFFGAAVGQSSHAMHSKCTPNTLQMHFKCAANALQLHANCAVNALVMRWQSVANELLMRC